MPGWRAARLAAMTDYGHALEFGVFVTPSAEDADAVVELATLADRSGSTSSPSRTTRTSRASSTPGRCSRSSPRGRAACALAPNVLNLPLRPPGDRRPRRREPRRPERRARRARHRRRRVLGRRSRRWAARGSRPGESVDALEEAIEVIRALWDVGADGRGAFDGRLLPARGAARGPAPLHAVGDLGRRVQAAHAAPDRPQGRRLAAEPAVPARTATSRPGNAAIDAAAVAAGRDPAAIRRLLNVPAATRDARRRAGPVRARGRRRHVHPDGRRRGDDRDFAAEVVPAVRERVAAARRGAAAASDAPAAAPRRAERRGEHRSTALGVAPTPDDGARLSATVPWDESRARAARAPAPM